MMDAKAWGWVFGTPTNLNVHWTLNVRIWNFRSAPYLVLMFLRVLKLLRPAVKTVHHTETKPVEI